MTTDQTPIQALIAELGIHLDATFIPRSQTDNAAEKNLHKMQIHWNVRLYREKRAADIRTSFHQGIGHLPRSIRLRDIGRVTVDEHARIVSALETGRNTSRYFPGKALPRPNIADVLHCLLMDGSAIDYPTFEEWAPDMGFDADSRKGEAIYQACVRTGLRLRLMFTEAELATLREAFQDY